MAFALGHGAAEHVEPKTGLSFPTKIGEMVLVATGVKNVKILGVKTITVYAFGVYADPAGVKAALCDKYGSWSIGDIKKSPEVLPALAQSNAEISVRIVVSLDKTQMKMIRNGLDEEITESLKNLTKNDEKQLVQRFLSAYPDSLKVSKGTDIVTTRLSSQTLKTYFEGKEVGSVQSALLAHAWADLYFGSNPVDKVAKETVAEHIAKIIRS